jgi:phage shock protein PspC (stress-responsive transcriptional regulator)
MARLLRRRREGRWIGGVCAGVADLFGWPVLAVRLVWTVAAAIPVVPGLPAYLLLWLLLPADGSASSYSHHRAASR